MQWKEGREELLTFLTIIILHMLNVSTLSTKAVVDVCEDQQLPSSRISCDNHQKRATDNNDIQHKSGGEEVAQKLNFLNGHNNFSISSISLASKFANEKN